MLRSPDQADRLGGEDWNALIAAARAEQLIGSLAVRLEGHDVPEKVEIEIPPEVTVDEVRRLVDIAMSEDKDLEMVYVAKTGQKLALLVQPQRIAFKADSPVLVGFDRTENQPRTFVLDKIERLRLVEAPANGD